MKKCIIYVFSGTGNTHLIAELYKKFLIEYETTIYPIKMPSGKVTSDVPNPADFDMVGIGHPVHGFNAPRIMWEFCKSLPATQKPAFILTTSGEGLHFNDFASQKVVRLMSKKGYDFVQQMRYVMPYNMIFRHSPEMVKSEYLYAEKLAEHSCKEIQAGTRTKIHRRNFFSAFAVIVRFLLWIYARVQSPFMRVNKKTCIACQKCVRVCPYGNITYDSEKNRFKFGTNCLLCVACSFGCPTCSISIGLLNGWRVNGDYKILEIAKDESIDFPYFTKENLHGLKRILYLGYYNRVRKLLGAE